MLELKNIVKDYVSGNNVTHALKGISVNFRKNEFVSILGASGCGKTTTLNIIGGLDRYTSGDLLINGKSTKEYKDRDWDTYRNHSIGFVFQTYNLISHQSILRNVELALTISGVSKEERKQRAYKALETVGLKGMEKKKPNQLSGGQCQRVAIARALINNPEIVLADEPTGALDSETSIQIMELLKEVASNRLVIMVTHNPDLAYKYSTRIVKMSDGLIIDDTDPFNGKGESKVVSQVSKGRKKKSSMSLKTATGLSLSNLGSKLRRTILVTIAGSIGIIGVSAVLGVSKGVKNYINNMQNDMLSAYPLTISEETADYSSLMSGLNSTDQIEKFKFDPNDPKVGVDSMINYLMTAYEDVTKVKTNTITDDLLAYVESAGASALKYDYAIDVTNNIFGKWNKGNDETVDYSLNGLIQSYIAELKTVENFEDYAKFVNLFTNFMNELPDNPNYFLDQYNVLAKSEDSFVTRENHKILENELVLVVDKDTTLTDLTLAEIGVFGHDEFLNIAKKAIKEQTIRKDESLTKEEKDSKIKELNNPETTPYPYRKDFKYEDLIDREYEYFPQSTIYEYGEIDSGLTQILFNAVDMNTFSSYNLEFDADLDTWQGTFMNVSNFLSPDKLLFTRTSEVPGEEVEGINRTIGSWEFNDGESVYSFEIPSVSSPSVNITKNGTAITYMNLTSEGMMPIVSEVPMKITGWHYPALKDNNWTNGMPLKISAILQLNENNNFGSLERGIYYSKDFATRFINDSNKEDAVLTKALKNNIESQNSALEAFVTFTYENHHKEIGDTGHGEVQNYFAGCLNGDMSSSISSLFSGLMGGINGFDTDKTHLRSVAGLKVDKIENEFVYSLVPKTISLYPTSFEAKESLKNYLEKWNDKGPLTYTLNGVTRTIDGNRDELTVTDTIAMIITLINSLIEAITVSLVVFTSLSLVVSCFMIAVITYISVVERIKEIGIIRSLGGRKRDVANLFIMETFLTGLFSGLFGIGITYILQVVLNAILVVKFNIAIMKLTIGTAAIMVGISVVLSVLSGLIPSQSAAHKDPVVALRTGE